MHLDAERGAPLEQSNVLQRRRPLFNSAEGCRTQTFQAWLNLYDPSGPQLRQLRLAEVGLYLVEQSEIALRFDQPRDQRVERPTIEDVVGGVEVQALISSSQVDQLVKDPTGFEPAERHRRSVQTAKAAVVLLAPPAAARAFKRNAHLG